MHDRPLAAVRLACLVLWTGLLLPPALAAWTLRRRVPAPRVRSWNRGYCAIAGVEVRVVGTPDPRDGLLFVANHISHLDIIALGSRVDAAFVAKAEVAGWPGIGLIARLGRTVFVKRSATHSARQCATLAARLGAGERLILFAEGASGGLAIGRALRACYAWYGDMALLPHLWTALGLPGGLVELRFHEPLPANAFASRKALAAHAERQVASGLRG